MSAAAHLYQRGDCRMMAQKIADLEHDCLCLALRLYAVDESTFAVETAAVMERWRPRCAIELGLAEPHDPMDFEPSEEAREACTWKTRALVNADKAA